MIKAYGAENLPGSTRIGTHSVTLEASVSHSALESGAGVTTYRIGSFWLGTDRMLYVKSPS